MNIPAVRFGAEFYRAGCIVNRNRGLENMQVLARGKHWAFAHSAWSAGLTENLGPVLGSVINAQEFHDLVLNAIHNDVGQSRENQLTLAGDPPLPSKIRELSEGVAAVIESLSDIGSGDGIILLNVTHDVVEIVGGGSSPAQAH